MSKSTAKRVKKILRRNRYLINIIIILLGIVATILGFVIPNEVVEQILLSIGLSFVGTGIVTIITVLAMDTDDDSNDFVSEWGVEQIYSTRSEMNSHTAVVLPNMKKEYYTIAFGVKSLRDAYDKLFMEKVKHGLKIKFITMHPDSKFLVEREKIEQKQVGEIRKTIIDLISWIEKLKKIARNPNNVQIKFYDSIPLDFFCKIDDNIYIGPYLYGKESQQTISYRFSETGKGFTYYLDYFNNLWDNPMMKELETVKKEINYDN